ncbi:MAG TPA: hypothetical protein VLG28_00800 [Acidimicrobiia bacterium]|jgi:hypothetical protein|nr:hypothetical protein [Acidimicrobiia bacterium]
MWPLSRHWYGDRLDPKYRPAPLEALQRMLRNAGLTGAFWQLA